MSSSYTKFILISCCTAALSLFCGCSKNDNPVDSEQIVGSGRLVSESRNLGSFTGIQVSNFAKVLVTQDTIESLRIESDDNIIDRVLTSMNGRTLVVGLRDGSYNNVTVNVYASMKNIKLLESIGAAEFSSTNSIETDSLTCRITGTANVTLSGITNYENIEIIGSGNVHNLNLLSSFCHVTISGTGNVEVNAAQQLDAIIAGTGNITYTGNPPVFHQTITGAGVIQPKH